MTAQAFFAHPLWSQLAAMHLHFLWQGLLIAWLYWTAVKLFAVRSAEVRYLLGMSGLAAMLFCNAATFVWAKIPIITCDQPPDIDATFLRDSGSSSNIPAGRMAAVSDRSQGQNPFRFREAFHRPTRDHAGQTPLNNHQKTSAVPPTGWLQPLLLGGWFFGVLMLGVRLLAGARGVLRWRRAGVPVLDPLWQDTLERLSRQMGLRAPRLAASSAANDAFTMGLFRPVIILPAAWLFTLPPDTIEAVLAHELAHIRRWDAWANLFQRVLEAWLFYHPAVWWLSREMESEREKCTDLTAVSLTGDRLQYVKTLANLAESLRANRPAKLNRPIFATGIGGKKMVLLERVRHLLGQTPRTGTATRILAGAIVLALPAALWVGLVVLPATAAEETAALTELETAAKKLAAEKSDKHNPVQEALSRIAKMQVKSLDWPQWGGSSLRNNTPFGKDIPTDWDVDSGKNILWQAQLGSQTYGNPVVANGHVYVGTNNAAGYIARYPWNNSIQIDLGCLVCFDEKTGKFLWQHSSPKLASGRVHDWPLQGICCAPYVDGERLWFVSSRGEVLCLDTQGFLDGENNGPFKAEDNENKNEADVIWRYDMMGEMGTSQHNMCSCSVTCAGDVLFVNTSNGLDESHINLPAPNAPSFFAMNRDTGKVLWTDKSPGTNILHGQWSSPTYAVLGGREQVLFAGGDGWLYSFAPKGDGNGNSKLLWKFDANPKDSKWILGGRGTRNNIIATPVVYDGMVYVAVGQDPEHGEGQGHLWCIDPTGNGDVSATLAQDAQGKPLAHKRIQAVDLNAGEKIVPNPNSKAIWHYDWHDADGNGKDDFEEVMHRSCGTVAIKDDLLFIADFSGLFHCLDAREADEDGKPTVHWTYDMFAAAWGSPLIVEDKVYIGDEDGDVAIFKLSKKQEMIAEINMGNSVYSTPIVANNVLYIANKNTLYAIGNKPEK